MEQTPIEKAISRLETLKDNSKSNTTVIDACIKIVSGILPYEKKERP